MRSATSDQCSSQPKPITSEGEHATDVVAAETSWFSTFNDRQNKEAQAPRPKRKVAVQPQYDAIPDKNKFLVPNTGPQLPNRYFSTDYCTRDPPVPFKGPPASLRDCHKGAKPCFMDTFKPKVDDSNNMLQSVSRVACNAKKETGKFCEVKPRVKPFSLCPKPVHRETIFKCPEVPKIPRKPKKQLLKCEERKPPSYKVCPKPPPRKRLPMCLVLSGKIPKEKKPKPPPTPRRCLCADDPENFKENNTPPLYKMNPEIPFPVCPKRKMAARTPYRWPSTNKVCKGASKGCDPCNETTTPKTAACKSIRGEPCVEEHACPYHPARPPPPKSKCGPVSRPAFPTGSEEPFTTASADPSATSTAKHFPSSKSAPKNVQSLTTVTKRVSSSSMSAPKSSSASTSTPRSSSSMTSLPKQSSSAASTSKAASVSQPNKTSSKPPSAMAFNKSTKLDCKKMAFNKKQDKHKSGGKCQKIRWPPCGVAARTDCGPRKGKKRVCVKKQAPTPCFSDCYKGPCPPKICNPCPCVHMASLTECDIKAKIRHLQPRESIFEEKRPFVLPPPTVELFVDPSIAACCEATKASPMPSIPSPKITNEPSVPAPVPKKKEKEGCDCSIANFFRSLLAFMKGEDSCPTPPDKVKKAAKSMDCDCSKYAKPAVAKATDSCVTDSPDRDRDPRPVVKTGKTKKSSAGACAAKFKLAGCKARVREDCSIVRNDPPCKKRLALRPSFSECVRDDFPSIRCTECRISLKRAKSLSELRAKGLRVTPENLRVHCSKCLNPTTRGCEIVKTKLDCFKVSHMCKISSCTPMGSGSPKNEKSTEKKVSPNPPRPTKEYSGPKAKAKVCDKPPAATKKDCKNMPKPKKEEKTKNLPCNTQDEKPPKNKSCDLDDHICETLEPYRMPEDRKKK